MRLCGDTSKVSSGRLPIFVTSQGGRRNAVTWVARGVGSMAALFAFAMVASFIGVPGVRGVGLPFASRTSADSSPSVVMTSSSEPTASTASTASTAPAVITPASPSDTAFAVDVVPLDQPLVGEVSTVVADPPADDASPSVVQATVPNAPLAPNVATKPAAPTPVASPSPTTVATVATVSVPRAPTTNPPRAATTSPTTTPIATAASSVGPKVTAPGQVTKSGKSVSPSVTAPGHA